MVMEKTIEIKLHAITLKDENSGEEKTIHTVRDVDELADYLCETETTAIGKRIIEIEKALRCFVWVRNNWPQ